MTAPELAQQVDVKHIEGKKLAEHKQPQDALRVYDEAIAIAGNDPGLTAWIRFDKGKTLTSLGRFQEALSEFQQAQGYLGENTWVFTEIGNAHIGIKQLNNAEQEFTLALKGNPENWEAAQGLERVTQMRQQAEHLHVLGVQKLNEGDREGAQQAYREAINLVGAENAPWSVFDLGKTYESMGRYDEALILLEQSKQLLPGVIWPDVEIGRVYIGQKDLKRAESVFSQLDKDYPKNDTALEGLARIKKMRDEAEFFHVEGVRLRNAGNYQEAILQYQQAIDKVGETNAPWSVFDFGVTLRQIGRHSDAINYLQKAQNLMPHEIWPYIQLGEVQMEVHNSSGALFAFKNALKVDPNNQIAQGWIEKITKAFEAEYNFAMDVQGNYTHVQENKDSVIFGENGTGKVELVKAIVSREKIAEVLKITDIHGEKVVMDVIDDNIIEKDLTVEDIIRAHLYPKHEVTVEGKEMYFSDIYEAEGVEGRPAVMAYVKKGDRFIARTFYLSNSQGIWRYLPLYRREHDRIRHLNKGYSEESIALPIPLQQVMNEIFVVQGDPLTVPGNGLLYFVGTARHIDKYGEHTFVKEIESTPIQLEGNFHPNHEERNQKIDPNKLIFDHPETDAPDFTKIITSWEQKTKLYGDITVEIYNSKGINPKVNGGKLQYMICRDKRNRVWIADIENMSEIQSVGLRKQWVNSGDLATPLKEYPSQDGGYGNRDDSRDGYIDMFENYIRHIPIIKDYYRERQLMPLAA